MDMKRILLVIAAVSLIIVVEHDVRSRRDAGRGVTSAKILMAAKGYAASLKAKGVPVPDSVSAETLIDQGLLTSPKVSGFTGAGVTVNLAADPSRPRDVVFWAKGENDTEFMALVDGKVQQVRK